VANNTNIWASGAGFDAKKFDQLIQQGVPWAQAIEQAGGGAHTGPLPTPSPYSARTSGELPPVASSGLPPMNDAEDDEDETPLSLPGFSVKDAEGQYGAALGSYRSASADLAALYKQAEQELRDRRSTPWTSPENLLALSAAFFQPTRQRGFAGMMSNVMPTLQGIAAQREADQRKKDEMLRTYGFKTAEARLGSAETEAKMAERRYAAAVKAGQPPKTHVSVNPLTGETYDTSTGFAAPNAAQVSALISQPNMAEEFDRKFGPGAAARVLAQYGGRR